MTARHAVSSQVGIFYHEQRNPGRGSYNAPAYLDVRGDLAVGDAVRACAELVATTPALRLRFGLTDSGEVGYWFDGSAPHVDVVDGEIDVAEQLRTPFDTDGGPLVRFVVARPEKDRTSIVVLFHHLVGDGVSQALLPVRLARCIAGRADPQPEEAYDELVSSVYAAEEIGRRTLADRWLARLPERPPLMPWPDAGVGPAGHHRLRFSRDDRANLGKLASDIGTTLFHTVAAVVHRVLALNGVRYPSVSAVTSVRPPGGQYDHIPGCFINQVPLFAPDSAGSLRSTLAANTAQWRDDLKARAFPFLDLAARMRARTGETARLDRAVIGLRPLSTPDWSDGGLEYSTHLYHEYAEAKSDLSFRFFQHDNGLDCDAEFASQVPSHVQESLCADLRRVIATEWKE